MPSVETIVTGKTEVDFYMDPCLVNKDFILLISSLSGKISEDPFKEAE
jgi:hypothetical protein